MNYLIITYDDYRNIPYIKNYEEYLRKNGNEYDIILWDRSGDGDSHVPNSFVFEGRVGKSRVGKIIPFLRWRRFAMRVMKEKKYDRVIVLTTLPAVLLADRLCRDFRGRYWLDIRDFTYENIPPYRSAVERLVRNADVTSISSAAFSTFLPSGEPTVLAHNITNTQAECPACALDKDKACFSIGFVGGIRYEKQNKQLLRQLANDPKYRLYYIGKKHPGCDLEAFCREEHIENVVFRSAYENSEKPQIYESLDLINCVYGCDRKVETLALPNKLYDCVLFKKPMLVSKHTYLSNIVEEYRLGLSVDAGSDNIARLLDEYLAAFDKNAFEDGCRRFIKKVKEENAAYFKVLEGFCSGRES